MDSIRDPERRRTLVVLGRATGCALGLVALPTLGVMAQSSEAAAVPAPFASAGVGLEDLEQGQPRRVRIEGELPAVVWLVRQGDEVRAFAARCPHLGCSVGVAEDHQSFECPCHHARFGLDGSRLERGDNPAPRDLDPLEARVDPQSSKVEVRVVHYQPGIGARVVVG